jgi:hypothetical protein
MRDGQNDERGQLDQQCCSSREDPLLAALPVETGAAEGEKALRTHMHEQQQQQRNLDDILEACWTNVDDAMSVHQSQPQWKHRQLQSAYDASMGGSSGGLRL